MSSQEESRSDKSASQLIGDFVFDQRNLSPEMVPKRDRQCSHICCVCNRGLNSRQSIKNHVSSKVHIVKVKEQRLVDILPCICDPVENHLSSLTSFLEESYTQLSASCRDQLIVREKIGLELHNLLQQTLKDVEVKLHGSSASRYALVDSDVNLSISIPDKSEVPTVMKAALACLRASSGVYREVKDDFFSYNKIPRILFRHKHSGLLCELRANADNPVFLAHLLKKYGSMDDRALKLGILFKYWAKVCRVDAQENGHYPSHVFVLMTIHYLQQTDPPVLPVLHECCSDDLTVPEKSKDEPSPLPVDTLTQLSFEWSSNNDESLGKLWYGMFRYYGLQFNMDKLAITIRQSCPLLREDRQWGSSRLAVEDPLIPKSNVARTASSDKVFIYLQMCLQMGFVYFSSADHQIISTGSPHTLKYYGGECVEKRNSGIVFPIDPVFSESVKTSFTFLHKSLLHVEENPSVVQPSRELCHNTQIEFGSFPGGEYSSVDVTGKSYSTGDNISPCKGTEKKAGASMQVFSFHQENFVLQSYPVVCLNCKRHGHLSRSCPTDVLPVRQLDRLRLVCPSHHSLRNIESAFMGYLRSVIPRPSHLQIRREICDIILRDMNLEAPDASLELFGSSANGFGSYRSDLDMCLIFPSDKNLEKKNKVEIIKYVASELRKYPKRYTNISTVTTARVPIVNFKVMHDRRMECDVSLGNQLALRNTKMLAAYSNIDGRVKPLGYALKYFAKLCDIGDASTGSLSSYAYIIMLIHYLQRVQPPILPVLQELQAENGTEFIIDGWNCYYFTFDSPHDLIKVWPHYNTNRQSIGELWLGFLWYVLKFNWDRDVITIRHKKPLSKVDKWWMHKVMCIEDPFDLSHNLASAVTGKMRMYIYERFLFAIAFHSQSRPWRTIESMMDKTQLVGEDRAPKYSLCNHCNQRGHKARECPNLKNVPINKLGQ